MHTVNEKQKKVRKCKDLLFITDLILHFLKEFHLRATLFCFVTEEATSDSFSFQPIMHGLCLGKVSLPDL